MANPDVRPPLAIRLARPDDALALADLLTQLSHPTSAAEVLARLPGLITPVLVAVRGPRVVGTLTTSMMPVLHRPMPVGRVSALVVAASERGTGVGRRLVAEAERRLLALGCGQVEITSNVQRAEAHAFYRHLGYEVTSVRFSKPLPGGTKHPAVATGPRMP